MAFCKRFRPDTTCRRHPLRLGGRFKLIAGLDPSVKSFRNSPDSGDRLFLADAGKTSLGHNVAARAIASTPQINRCPDLGAIPFPP